MDGGVAGTWRVERTARKATLAAEAFERLPRSARDEVSEEGARLVRFVEPDAASHRVSVGVRA